MLSKLVLAFILNPFVTYPLAIIGLIPLFLWIIIEYREYQTRLECQRRNLRYVRMPSQILSQMFGLPRFDLAEIDLMQKNGPVYGCSFLNELTIGVCDPELMQIICNKEFTKLPNRRPMKAYDKTFDSFLFATNGDTWKRLRAIVSPTFSSGKLRKIKYCIDDTVQTMVDHFDETIVNDPVVNMKAVIGSFTMDTIIQMAYGVKIDSLREPNNPIIVNSQNMFGVDMDVKNLIFFFVSNVCPNLNKFLGLRFKDEHLSYFENFSMEIIKKKREEFLKKQGKASNFIELILEVEQEQQNINENDSKPFKHLNNDEIIAQCVTFFMVGYDTTATSIINTCYLLAKNPEKQEKLYQSIQNTLQELTKESTNVDPYELITFDSLNRFDYVNAVLNESLRLLTIAPAIERVSSEDFLLETPDKRIQVPVKRGDIVRIGVAKMHLDPANFSNPDQFIPERFLPDSTEKVFQKHAFVPFGSGPRGCLAKHLALLEAKMALVHLFRLFQFHVDSEKTPKKLDIFRNIDTNITKDIHLRVQRRCKI